MSRRPYSERSSHGDDRSYSLDDLTSLADVTVRTVRYYIAEGLLPPPLGAGRNASYTQEHLDRLRLITRLKEEYLPLKEIRRRLQSMTIDEIRDILKKEDYEETSAARYIAHAIQESDSPRYDSADPRGVGRRAVRQPSPGEQTWRRIPISRDAELLITESAHRRRSDQLEAAIDWFRRILNES